MAGTPPHRSRGSAVGVWLSPPESVSSRPFRLFSRSILRVHDLQSDEGDQPGPPCVDFALPAIVRFPVRLELVDPHLILERTRLPLLDGLLLVLQRVLNRFPGQPRDLAFRFDRNRTPVHLGEGLHRPDDQLVDVVAVRRYLRTEVHTPAVALQTLLESPESGMEVAAVDVG